MFGKKFLQTNFLKQVHTFHVSKSAKILFRRLLISRLTDFANIITVYYAYILSSKVYDGLLVYFASILRRAFDEVFSLATSNEEHFFTFKTSQNFFVSKKSFFVDSLYG